MKIMTVLGTRPEIIRLSRIISVLDDRLDDHVVVHTGQNAQAFLNENFFEDLKIRKPDICLEVNASSLSEQLYIMMQNLENVLDDVKPDKVLVLGDTNSSLAATIISERKGYPVYHMEAGNRCHDRKVPEEINRKIIDSIASINMPYTEIARENLLREGKSPRKIFKTGNPIGEVVWFYDANIYSSQIMSKLELQRKKFVLVTSHRSENVDNEERLKVIFNCLEKIAEKYTVVFSCHPRTADKIKTFDIEVSNNVLLCEPFNFSDFASLQQNCKYAITDSGTVQEEMCLFNRPVITIRDTTEREETVLCGANIVCGLDEKRMMEACQHIETMSTGWVPPEDYVTRNVSAIVANILMQEIDHAY